MESPKTLVVFLDGADWPLLQPLVDRGWLPTFQRLLAQGTSASVTSLAPFSAPMLLASAVTGQRAWRHGVVAGEGGRTSAALPRTTPLWEIASAAGRPTIVVGGHAATPTRPFSGAFVAEPFFTGTSDSAVLPASLAEELAPLRVTRNMLDPGIVRLLCPRLAGEVAAQDPLAGRLADALSHLYSVHNVAASLLETEPWRLGVVHHSFLATIRQCFGALERAETPVAVQTRYEDVVAGSCRLMDLLLGQLLATVGHETRVLVASPRGGPALDPRMMADYPLRSPGSGCLLASGPGIRAGVRLGTFSLLDLAPTILHSLGLPCPGDRDGRVLDELFESGASALSFGPASSEEAIALAPEPAALGALESFNLAVDLFEASRCVEALPYIERAAELRPESPVFAFGLACCLARLGLDAEAEAAVEVLRDREDEPRWQVRARLAVVAALGGRHGRIRDLAPLPITPGTLPPIAVSALANALMETRRWDDASELVRDHLLHRPTNDLWLGLARCYLHWHRYQDAGDAARHVLANDPGVVAAHVLLARALQGGGRREEAEGALREVHRLAPQSPEARAAVAGLQPALAAQLSWRIAPATKPDAGLLRAALHARRRAREESANTAAEAGGALIAEVFSERTAGPIACRGMRPDEAARVAALLGDAKLLKSEWRPRVWEALTAPRRFVGAASWRVAPGESGTAHLAIALLPRFRKEESALALMRPLIAQIESAGFHRVLISTREAAAWEAVFQRLGFAVEHWTDETWAGDPVRLRERLRRYDEMVPVWREEGWRLRPFAAEDWELVRRWGVDTEYLSVEHFERLRASHDPGLSRLMVHRDVPVGMLVAARSGRTVVLEFLAGAPERPGGWGLSIALLLRWFVNYDDPAPSYDQILLTKNLHRDRRHRLAALPGLRRRSEQHHFLICR